MKELESLAENIRDCINFAKSKNGCNTTIANLEKAASFVEVATENEEQKELDALKHRAFENKKESDRDGEEHY